MNTEINSHCLDNVIEPKKKKIRRLKECVKPVEENCISTGDIINKSSTIMQWMF